MRTNFLEYYPNNVVVIYKENDDGEVENKRSALPKHIQSQHFTLVGKISAAGTAIKSSYVLQMNNNLKMDISFPASVGDVFINNSDNHKLKERFTIIYDITYPHIPGTENPKQYSPSVLLPDDHPQKHWPRNQFYSSLTSHLANLGYEKLQNCNHQKESPYIPHTIQGLHWLPFCVNKMHIDGKQHLSTSI
ncbi:hypothetical protein ACTFIR_007080 [Dictyostelium discoideum]